MSGQRELPLFPLNTVLFPGMVLPLHIFEDRYKKMINYCITNNEPFGVVLIRDGLEVGGQATVFDVGTTAHITQVDPLDEGRMNLATLGVHRFKIHEVHQDKYQYLIGTVSDFPFTQKDSDDVKTQAIQLRPMLLRYLDILTKMSDSEIAMSKIPEDPTTLAFLTAIVLQAPVENKQKLLSVESLSHLLKEELNLLSDETLVLEILQKSAPNWSADDTPFSPN